MSEFTKGEWKVVDGTLINEQCLFVYVDGAGVVCRLTYTVNNTPLTDEDVANAHLIAAAPDMYKNIKEDIEVLERQSKQYVCGSFELRSILLRIKTKEALLAKARGET